MITTTVIWPQDQPSSYYSNNGMTNPLDLRNLQNPNVKEQGMLEEFANSIDPTNQVLKFDKTDTQIVVLRQWATVEQAQAWLDYLTTNYRITSAVINP
jgi:hypothetical protein